MGERRLFRYVALCIGGDFSATRANYTSDVEFALGLPWCWAAMIRGVMSHGDVQRSRLQRENTLNKRRWATSQKIFKKAQEGYPETVSRKPKDGPRGSQEATNKARYGPLFDEFAPGLPWCRGARSPSRGSRGPQEEAKKAQEGLFDQFAPDLLWCRGTRSPSTGPGRTQMPQDSSSSFSSSPCTTSLP